MLCNVCNAHVQNNNKSKSKKGPRYRYDGVSGWTFKGHQVKGTSVAIVMIHWTKAF